VNQLSKVAEKMKSLHLAQMDVSKTSHTVAMMEPDAVTEKHLLQYIEMTTSLSTDACGLTRITQV